MSDQNPYQAPEENEATALGSSQDLLRGKLCRQRIAAQVIAVSLFVYAALRLLVAGRHLIAIRTTDAIAEYLGETQVGINWDTLIRGIVGLFVGGAMGTFAIMFGIYARRLRDAANGQIGADSLIKRQTCLWYAAASLGIIYLLSQILSVFALPHFVWILLEW